MTEIKKYTFPDAHTFNVAAQTSMQRELQDEYNRLSSRIELHIDQLSSEGKTKACVALKLDGYSMGDSIESVYQKIATRNWRYEHIRNLQQDEIDYIAENAIDNLCSFGFAAELVERRKRLEKSIDSVMFIIDWSNPPVPASIPKSFFKRVLKLWK